MDFGPRERDYMQIVTPVLNLAGNCEEAIHFYESAFDIKADLILHYSDAAKEDWKLPLTDIQKRYVYHAEMHIGKQRLMFSDIIEFELHKGCLLYTSPSPRDLSTSRMPSSA